jgi:heme exporter protein C
VFVIPRLGFTLHPDPMINSGGKIEMDPRIRICFAAMLVGFTGLYAWLQSLKVRLLRAERRAHRGLASEGRAEGVA